MVVLQITILLNLKIMHLSANMRRVFLSIPIYVFGRSWGFM